MPNDRTNAQSLGLYYTGAQATGWTQEDGDASLGGFRSATQEPELDVIVTNPIPPVIFRHVSGACGEGAGSIRANEDGDLLFTPPGGTEGAAVAIADGEFKTLEGGTDDDKAIRVERDGSTALTGEVSLEFVKAYGTGLGMDIVTNAERVAGNNTYRGEMFSAHGTQDLTVLKVWISTLATQATSDTTQLPGAGAGTIATTDSFADWPLVGWAHIRTAALATREIVYYTERTDTVLTISGAAFRGLLGTAAGGGAADDLIDSVPGLRIAKEAPGAGGDIQVIANESTAPAAVAWDTGITESTGLDIGSMSAGDDFGLWKHREIPAGAVVAAKQENRIEYSWTAGGTGYTNTVGALHRVADTTIEGYELYAGVDGADPDLTAAPDATSATLPFNFALTPPGGGTREYRTTVLFRDRYDLPSLNEWSRTVTIDTAGDEVVANPSAPTEVAVTELGGGEVRVEAIYSAANDASPADTFQIYVSGDGTDPVPGVDTPVQVTMGTVATNLARPGKRLRHTLAAGPYGKNETLRVIVTTFRVSDSGESTNTTATTLTITLVTPIAAQFGRTFLGTTHRQTMTPPTVSRTVVIDAGNSIEWRLSDGKTSLWAGLLEVLRFRFDANRPENIGMWTTFGFVQEAISGASGDDPVDVAAWNGQKTIYFTVAGVRRLELDVTAGEIKYTAIAPQSDGVVEAHSTSPALVLPFNTCFQVYDLARRDYVTVASLDESGILSRIVPLQQRQTVGEFE